MKKFTMIFASALLLFTMSACGEAKTDVSDGDKTLIKVGDDEITKSDVYTGLVASGGTTDITDEINKIIANKAVKTTDAIEKEAKEQLDSVKSSSGDKFNEALKSQGFKDENDYYKNSVLVSVKMSHLTESYINDDFVNICDEYDVRQVQVIQIKSAEYRNKVKKAAKEKKANFEAIATQFGDTSIYNGKSTVYTNKSGLPKKLWDEIMDIDKAGENTSIVKDSVTGFYYIAKVVNTNPKKFKKDAQNALKEQASAETTAQSSSQTTSDGTTQTTNSTELTLDEKAFNYFLNKYDFSIHDVDIYQLLLTNSQKYKED